MNLVPHGMLLRAQQGSRLLRQAWQKLGRLGQCAALCSLIALGLALCLWWAQADLDRQRSSIREQRQAWLRAAPSDAAKDETQDWRRRLPTEDAREARLAVLLSSAAVQGLPMPHTEVGEMARPTAGLAWLPLTMRVDGSYSAVRRYVESALQQDEGLALMGVQLQRQRADASTVTAELQWRLHMQVPPGRTP